MSTKKNKTFPIVITSIIIMIIIYLFATVEQPYITCSKSTTNDLDIRVTEDINVTIDGNKIREIDLTKAIVLPSNYLEDDIHLNSIKFSLKKHYEYLNKDVINYSLKDDRVVVNVLVDDDETLVLNNIEFFENGDKLEMKINSNTRSSDVVTLSVGDKYTEGELITRMKNNGYVCK